MQGPYRQAKTTVLNLDAAVNEMCDVQVTVDLAAQSIAVNLHGRTVEAKLTRRLDTIRYVGYCVNSVSAEFSPLKISTD